MNKLENKLVRTRVTVLTKRSRIRKHVQLQNISNVSISVFFDEQSGFFKLPPGATWFMDFKESPKIIARTERGTATISVMEIN